MILKKGMIFIKLTYKHTLFACYLGYITQAVVNNLPPLLFVTFSRQFHITLDKIALLISVNFITQIITDLVATVTIKKTGYRVMGMIANVTSTIGLVFMATLPFVFENAFLGIIIASVFNAIGGGIMEVLVSPMVEALPGDAKASAMSLLHSFYCWGYVGVVLLSTLYFTTIGIENWQYLPVLWAVIPFFNLFLFVKIPILTLEDNSEKVSVFKLFKTKVFWLLVLLMICSGASEMAMAQWSSLFAELGLGVSKTVGDLLGPCAFAILMGTFRTIYGIKGEKMNLKKTLAFSGSMCVVAYLVTVFSPNPIVSLVGCAFTGFFVGIMWPGVFSLASQTCSFGGTSMFGLLALAGDVGCCSGPALVGNVSDILTKKGIPQFLNDFFKNLSDSEIALRMGILCGMIFPLLLVIGIILISKKHSRV